MTPPIFLSGMRHFMQQPRSTPSSQASCTPATCHHSECCSARELRRPRCSARSLLGTRFSFSSILQAADFLLVTFLLSAAYAAEATISPGKLRASADTAFAEGKLEDAVRFLSQAIQIEPDNEKNHYKRYRAHLRAKKYKDALQDLTTSIGLTTDNGNQIQQRVKLYRMLGRCSDAVGDIQRLKGKNEVAEQAGWEDSYLCHMALEQAEQALQEHQWERARQHFDTALAVTEAAPELLYKRGVCSYHLWDFYGAAADTGRAIKIDPTHIRALELRGLAYFYLGEFDMALTHYREGLRFDPEDKGCKDGHRKVKKMQKTADKGQTAIDVGNLEDGISHFRDAMAVDPQHVRFNAPLLLKVARAYVKLRQFREALLAVDQAVEMDGGLLDAHIVKAEVLQASENYEEAVRVLKQAQDQFQGQGQLEEALKKAEIALKQSREVNYYKVLGVDRHAEASEIKKAYRALAKQYHPDKQAESSAQEKEKAEREFLKVTQAYEILSDEELRGKYDRGEDVSAQAQQQQQQAQQFNFAGGFPFGGFPGGGAGPGGPTFTFRFG